MAFGVDGPIVFGVAVAIVFGAGAAGAATAGAAGAAAGASRLVDSFTSVAALRNSRMLLPSDAPTSGSLPGPTTMSAMIRTMMSSPGPMLNGILCVDLVVNRAASGVARRASG